MNQLIKHLKLTILFLLALSGLSLASDRSLSLEIAVNKGGESSREVFGPNIIIKPNSHIHVLLKNISDESQAIGGSLSPLHFEVTNEKGKRYDVKPKKMSLRGVVAASWILEKNQTHVIDVHLGSQYWGNFPLPEKGESGKFILVAVYNSKLTKGPIKSEPRQFTIFNKL